MIKIKKEWGRSPWSLIKNDIKVKYFPGKIKKRLGKLEKKCRQRVNSRSLFTSIGLEAISACNNDCPFCPVSTVNNKRPVIFMDDLVFREIIKQLKELNFTGSLSLSRNNEPLLDNKLFWRIAHIRKHLGDNVQISIESNGILLTVPKIYRLFELGLDNIYINDYTHSWHEYLLFSKRIRKIFQGLDTKKINKNVNLIINHRLKKQILSDRSGKVRGRRFISITDRKQFCDFPFYSMSINPKGDIIICCRDSYWEEIMGNVQKNKLEEIWFNDKFSSVREAFLENKRILPLCLKCSSSGSITI